MSACPDNAALETSAYRKASLRILPLIALGYGAAYIDRVNISFASLQMNRDLNFSATVYGLGAGIFFLSYAACEVPSNLLLYRFGARRWLARIMVSWGIVAMAMVFVRTPTEFYVGRFSLGMAEAGFFPGVILPDGPATARWLTEPEREAVLARVEGRAAAHGRRQAEPIGPALRDSRVWLLGLFNFCMLGSSYAYSFSAPTIVQTLTGLSITGTGFVIAAMYLVAAGGMLGNAILGAYTMCRVTGSDSGPLNA